MARWVEARARWLAPGLTKVRDSRIGTEQLLVIQNQGPDF